MWGGFSFGSIKQATSSEPKLPQLILRWWSLALARQNQWVLIFSSVLLFPCICPTLFISGPHWVGDK